MNILTAIIAIATVVNVFVYYWESESNAKQIGTLSSKAGEIVGAMNTALSNNRTAIRSAFAENKTALDVATAQSKSALDASINQFHLEQRAWVGVTAIKGQNFTDTNGNRVYIKEGEITQLEAEITNSGKTVATQVRACVTGAVLLASQNFVPKDSDCSLSFPSSAVLLPGMDLTIRTDKKKASRTPAFVINAIRAGTLKFYFFGRIQYSDVFGAEHFYRFCSVLSDDLSRFVSCGKYNEAN